MFGLHAYSIRIKNVDVVDIDILSDKNCLATTS
jgi:hypothetical protein